MNNSNNKNQNPNTHGGMSGDQGKMPENYELLYPHNDQPKYSEPQLRTLSDKIMRDSDEDENKNESEVSSDIPAGYTYLGQFIDHDITFNKNGINKRSPTFDLDSLYGELEDEASDEYKENKKRYTEDQRFILGEDEKDEDVQFPRIKNSDLKRKGFEESPDEPKLNGENKKGHADIPDHRNDENIIISALHLTFQKYHNILMNKEGLDFGTAKKVVTLHYQLVVVFDFLLRIVGIDALRTFFKNVELDRGKFLPDNLKLFNIRGEEGNFKNIEDIKIPLEFAGACYRFGHSMVRSSYDFNSNFNSKKPNPLLLENLFFLFPEGRPDPNDPKSHKVTNVWVLSGESQDLNDRKIRNRESLKIFFKPDPIDSNMIGSINWANLIDTTISQVLYNLRSGEPAEDLPVAEDDAPNLPLRNLMRGQNKLNLPSGQQFLNFVNSSHGLRINHTKLQNRINKLDIDEDLKIHTPLWFYILKEAEVMNGGKHLGPLAGRLVAEVILGLLKLSPISIFSEDDENNGNKDGIIFTGLENKDLSNFNMMRIIKYVDDHHANL